MASPLQIYSSQSGVSPYWREKYERDSKKYWDMFYKRHTNKFFKDRHYLEKEWGHYFSCMPGNEEEKGRKVVLEVGCGAGNTIYPLVATFPDIFVHACDFSPRAIDLVKAHKDYKEDQVNAFVCDLTMDDLCKNISPSSVDIVTMVFVLSAVAPEKMAPVLANIRKVLKPNGHVLFRDYAIGDLAQERLTGKDQQISENFYVRGDGTRAFYFSQDFLMSLFNKSGFDTVDISIYYKQVENRSRELVMNRRWIQAVFCSLDDLEFQSSAVPEHGERVDDSVRVVNRSEEPKCSNEVDISEGIAVEMFGILPSIDEDIETINVGGYSFKIKALSKEFQHTCKSTGLILWESARFMSTILAENPCIVAGKKVLELGCGSCGICSMVAAKFAQLVVASDGDQQALDLLNQNVRSNMDPPILNRLITKRLEWGNRDHINGIKEELSNNGEGDGFDVIIGTDITYIPDAITPLFQTASALLRRSNGSSHRLQPAPALILCHVMRRVDEASILLAASEFGFKLVDRWPPRMGASTSDPVIDGRSRIGVIDEWFFGDSPVLQSTIVNIMYFHQCGEDDI